MPVFEMPLERLREYQGRNPRPDDHESYWEKALAEMRATHSNVELVPYPLKSSAAECFDLYFTGVGGARVHAKYLRPRQARGAHPALLLFHGYSGNSGGLEDQVDHVR